MTFGFHLDALDLKNVEISLKDHSVPISIECRCQSLFS